MGIIIGVVVLALVVVGVVFAMKGKGGGSTTESSPSARPQTSAPGTPSAPRAEAAPAVQTAAEPAVEPVVAAEPAEAEPFAATAEAISSGSYDSNPASFTKPSASLPRLGLEPSGRPDEPVAVASETDTVAAAPEVVADADPIEFDDHGITWGHDPAEDDHADDDHADDDHAEVDRFDRFGSPGQRSKAEDDLLAKPLWEVAGGAQLMGASTADEPEAADEPEEEDVDWIEQPVLAEPEPEPVAEVEVEPVAEVEVEEPVLAEPEPELVAEVVEPELEPEPEPVEEVVAPAPVAADPVDHVLNALINRAKERQVGIAQVAAELVEQADLEDKEVDEVLADLLGVASGEAAEGGVDRPELTLFSTEVPQRPGQLTDFARLGSSDKKRALIRVLCLLVALQEEHKLDEREAAAVAEDDSRSWPLARAVWPVKTKQRRDDDPDLPNRSDNPNLARTR